MKLPTLFKKDSKGRTRFWQIEFDQGAFRTREGLQGGKESVTAWTVCETTNAGRANERGPAAQAEFEARAKWQKKKDTGYAEMAEQSGAAFIEPMLAFPHIEYDARGAVKKDRMKDVKWPCIVQPKLDGLRCLVYLKDGKPYAQSRKGKPIFGVPHILAACAPLLARNPSLVLDGELYNHELKDDFNTIVSCVRKQNPDAAELAESARLVQYHIYDHANPGAGFTFERRRSFLAGLLYKAPACLQAVPSAECGDAISAGAYEASCVEAGYEGIMLRNARSLYQHRRTVDLLKVKQFQDEEFPIVRIEEGKGDRKGLASRVIVKLKDGQECAAGVMGNDAYAAELFRNRAAYAGKPATIKFQGYTPDGMLRFAKMKSIRHE